jgi:pimeloyl-ACP methyl ester carboxylesterase
MFLFAAKLFAQAEPPRYVQAASQFKKFYNNNKPDSIFTQFSPELKTELPQDKFLASTAQLKSQLGSLLKTEFYKYNAPLAVYKATFQNAVFLLNIALNNDGKLTGLQLSPYQDQANDDPSIIESPVSIKTLSSTISGTLSMPKSATGKIPVVLIIPAAGAVDRDGNGGNLGANSYKLLAAALGKNGIASVRYDKRMVGQSISPTKEKDMRFDDYFEDAYGLIDMLNTDKRFSKVIVLGHGQGSLIGIMVSNDDRVHSFISVEGTALTADKVLTEQVNRTYPKYQAEGFKSVLDTMRRGRIDYKVDPALYPVAKPSLQLYLMTWCRYDPQQEIKNLKKPVLIIQGSTDLETDQTSADRLKKSKTSIVAIINNMNYALKDAPADKDQNMAIYTKPDLPLKPELITTIVDFINK